MDRIFSIEQIQGFVGEIRDLRRGYATNFFWDEHKHPYWIDSGSFFYEKFEDCYIIFHLNERFTNLFYIATGIDSFANAYPLIKSDCNNVIEIVCKKEGKGEVEVLKNIGFVPYRCLYRMSHVGLWTDESWYKYEEVVYANEIDAILVYEALQKHFDPICEQLPSVQEVRDFANRQQILIVKEKNELCGFLIFEISGTTTWYLRYWYTSPEYRNQKIGAKLLKTALTIGKTTKRQQLWVISDNENAIKRYEHYGFKKEPIFDYVMIKK
jgi:ribosomal protein S18 acetylase RimI-like enzyme